MPGRSRKRHEPQRWFPLVGLIGIGALLFAVYVSYTANDGVPGQQYREYDVEVPDANRIVRNNQVRMAGVRVGQIARITPVPATGGHAPYARLHVKLEPGAPRVPTDTTAKVRPASILGATYLDLVPGTARETLPEGRTLPLAQSSRNVELTDLLDVFDRRTSAGLQRALIQIGGGLAGRGRALGETFAGLAELLPRLRAVSRTLATPDSRLGELIGAYERAIGAFDAARPALGSLVTAGARTFDALAASRPAIGRTLEAFPSTAAVTTRALAHLRPALDDLAAISLDLRPAADALPAALRQTNGLFSDTRPWLRETPRLATRLSAAAGSLQRFSDLPQTGGAIRRVGDVAVAAGELLEALTPAQVHCNYVTLFAQGWHNVFGTIGTGDGPSVGNVQLSQLGTSPLELLQNATPLPNLHTNYTPHANAQECESGNEPFSDAEQVLTNPAGHQSRTTSATTIDPVVRERARRAGLLATPPSGSR